MGARESLVYCQPRKSGTNDYAKLEGEGGGGLGQTRCTNYGYVKMVIFLKILAYRFCIDERKRRS